MTDEGSAWYEEHQAIPRLGENGFRKRIILFLLRILQKRPSIRGSFSGILNKIPCRPIHGEHAFPPFFIDWTKDDEVLELIEQLETSQLLFSHVNIVPNLILDVGASCGLSSHVLLAQSPSAILKAFEPRKDAFERCAQRMQQFQARVQVHHAAVGIEAGFLAINDGGVGTKTGSPREGDMMVSALSIDSLIAGPGGTGLVLKVDIEGAERELLPHWAPLLSSQSILLLETHHPLSEVRSYSQPLRKLNFRWHLLRYRQLPKYGGSFADWLILGPDVAFR